MTLVKPYRTIPKQRPFRSGTRRLSVSSPANTTKLGAAKANVNIVGQQSVIFQASQIPTLYDPSFIKTFRLRRGGVDVVRMYREDSARSNILAVDLSEANAARPPPAPATSPAAIRDYQREHATPPTVRVVQRHFRFASTNSVVTHLRALAAKNAVHQLPDGSWGVRASEVQGLFALPIYGAIPAGKPDAREQESTDTISVDLAALGIRPNRQRHLWALRVTGDSMIDAHICQGDIGMFERRDPHPGEIIAALVDGVATTLKRLVLVRGKPLLRAANKRYSDIVPAERLECQGVLVGLIRRMATTG